MNETEANAMADEFLGVEREPNELIRKMIKARAGELAALILSVDARARTAKATEIATTMRGNDETD